MKVGFSSTYVDSGGSKIWGGACVNLLFRSQWHIYTDFGKPWGIERVSFGKKIKILHPCTRAAACNGLRINFGRGMLKGAKAGGGA